MKLFVRHIEISFRVILKDKDRQEDADWVVLREFSPSKKNEQRAREIAQYQSGKYMVYDVRLTIEKSDKDGNRDDEIIYFKNGKKKTDKKMSRDYETYEEWFDIFVEVCAQLGYSGFMMRETWISDWEENRCPFDMAKEFVDEMSGDDCRSCIHFLPTSKGRGRCVSGKVGSDDKPIDKFIVCDYYES